MKRTRTTASNSAWFVAVDALNVSFPPGRSTIRKEYWNSVVNSVVRPTA
jgi:hypothetical protein